MNAIVPVNDSPAFGLIPSSMNEAMRLAEMMAAAKLVPAALQKSPADCLMVIQQAVRWQMDPFAVAQECSVISGKLMHSGKLVAAVINARGNLAERLKFTYDGKGDERTITVSGRLDGENEARTVSVRLKDARTTNGMWVKQPDQQLMYHGSRVWARRHTPELMLGVYSPEEFEETHKQILRLPKKDARETYTRFQSEVNALKTRAELERWEDENMERVAVLPEDWEDILRLHIQERRLDIARAEPAQAGVVVTSTLDEMPETGDVVWSEETPPEWDSKWDTLGPVKQAGILCNDVAFAKFLDEKSQRDDVTHNSVADAVRDWCGVKSRTELATNHKARVLWHQLVADYRLWQRDELPSSHTADPAHPEGTPQVETGGAGLTVEEMGREAAMRGKPTFDAFYASQNRDGKTKLRAIKQELEALFPKEMADGQQ